MTILFYLILRQFFKANGKLNIHQIFMVVILVMIYFYLGFSFTSVAVIVKCEQIN